MIQKATELEANATFLRELKLIEALEQQYNTAKRLIDAKQFEQARGYVERVLTECNAAPNIKLMKANILINLKQYSEALLISGEVVREDENNPEALFIRGRVFCFMDNLDNAKKFFNQTLRLDPDFIQAQTELKKVKLLDSKKMMEILHLNQRDIKKPMTYIRRL